MEDSMSTKHHNGMGLFARYLTLWVFLCIAVGIALGSIYPPLFHALGSMEVAHINLPVAVLIWAMILLATVVGVLVEVPVMLSVVSIVNRSKNWYEA